MRFTAELLHELLGLPHVHLADDGLVNLGRGMTVLWRLGRFHKQHRLLAGGMRLLHVGDLVDKLDFTGLASELNELLWDDHGWLSRARARRQLLLCQLEWHWRFQVLP